MTDTFDAVLAEMLGESTLFLHEITDYHTRLAAAHAAEVAERDARIAELEAARDAGADLDCDDRRDDADFWWNVAAFRAVELGRQIARAEAAERDARRYRMIRNPPPKGDAMCAWSTTEDGVLSARGKHDGPLTGEPLDAAIDAAMQASREGR